tara:strand:+ start:564 stop:1007 length:444 start_codon:yes stop_codon:yes gene_type:complete
MNKKILLATAVVVLILILIRTCFVLFKKPLFESFSEMNGELTSLEVLKDENTMYLIKFYASWCGHCKNMKDEWEQLYHKYEPGKLQVNGNTVKIIQINADSPHMKSFVENYQHDITGFPTIIKLKNGVITEYNGERTFDSMDKFLTD